MKQIFILVIFAAFILLARMVFTEESPNDSATPNAGSSTAQESDTTCSRESPGGSAYVYSKDFVREHLRSPSTADFPFWSGWSARMVEKTASDVCTWRVNSYVDAQNAFGATVRTHYTAVLNYHKGKWTLLSLDM